MAVALALLSHATGLLNRTELQTIDARFSVRGPQPQLVSNLMVVGVDDATFSRFTQLAVSTHGRFKAAWPFPRRYEARVIANLARAGARQIAVDIQFTEPTDRRDDDALALAIWHAGHVVLATTAVGPRGSTSVLGGNANLWRFGHSVAADATVFPDGDGSLRRMRYSFQGLESFAPAIAGEVLRHRISPALYGGPSQLQPVDYAGPPGTVPYLSFWRVYEGRFPSASVRGKVVIIGATAPTLQDRHVTPTSGSAGSGELMSGPEIQANMVATVLHRIPLRFGAGWVNVLMIMLLGSLVPLLGMRGWALRALFSGVAAGVVYVLGAQLAFNSGTIIAVADPLLALVLGTIGTLTVVYLGEAFERQYARTTFARFVPPDVVDQVLASTDDDLRLAGVERVCTVMFSDLRGFTQFSETQPVERVIAVVNHYLNEMSQAIMGQGGTLISYMGDGIMAVFGAPLEQPDHADRALRAAREMIGPRLAAFNAWLEQQGYPSGLKMGVGLNSGKVMCGNVGAEQRVEYTAIGDTTNTASRLEGMTKGQPQMLFVAESTRELMLEAPADLGYVGEFEVRGREAKLRVYSLPVELS